jgi:hypothetical protein
MNTSDKQYQPRRVLSGGFTLAVIVGGIIGLGSPLEHIYMSFRVYTSHPVRGSCPNRYRRLRRDFCGDILAGVPVPCAL